MNNRPEWEESYDNSLFPMDLLKAWEDDEAKFNLINEHRTRTKSFISQTIESVRKEERERIKGILEGIKKPEHDFYTTGICDSGTCFIEGCENISYNDALSEALRKIDEKII